MRKEWNEQFCECVKITVEGGYFITAGEEGMVVLYSSLQEPTVCRNEYIKSVVYGY